MTADPKVTRPTAYLIAASMQHAHSTATVDWDWEPLGQRRYRTPSGEIVAAVSDAERLRGMDRGTRLYLGYRWFEAGRADHMHHEIDAGRFTVVKTELGPRALAHTRKELA